MIKCFNHAQITVPRGRSEEARHFFGTVLGLKELPTPDTLKTYGVIWFRVGERDELHVGQEDGIAREKTNAHLAFEVEDAGTWRKKFADLGIESFDQPVITGYDRFHIRDPFGNRMEFIGRAGDGPVY